MSARHKPPPDIGPCDGPNWPLRVIAALPEDQREDAIKKFTRAHFRALREIDAEILAVLRGG